MDQLHKRFSGEQVAFLLRAYSQGLITRVEIQEVLGIGKTRFFALWGEYRRDPACYIGLVKRCILHVDGSKALSVGRGRPSLFFSRSQSSIEIRDTSGSHHASSGSPGGRGHQSEHRDRGFLFP